MSQSVNYLNLGFSFRASSTSSSASSASVSGSGSDQYHPFLSNPDLFKSLVVPYLDTDDRNAILLESREYRYDVPGLQSGTISGIELQRRTEVQQVNKLLKQFSDGSVHHQRLSAYLVELNNKSTSVNNNKDHRNRLYEILKDSDSDSVEIEDDLLSVMLLSRRTVDLDARNQNLNRYLDERQFDCAIAFATTNWHETLDDPAAIEQRDSELQKVIEHLLEAEKVQTAKDLIPLIRSLSKKIDLQFQSRCFGSIWGFDHVYEVFAKGGFDGNFLLQLAMLLTDRFPERALSIIELIPADDPFIDFDALKVSAILSFARNGNVKAALDLVPAIANEFQPETYLKLAMQFLKDKNLTAAEEAIASVPDGHQGRGEFVVELERALSVREKAAI